MVNRFSAACLALLAFFLLLSSCRPQGEGGQPVLNQNEREYVSQTLSGMKSPVELVSFSSPASATSEHAVSLFEEIGKIQKMVVHEKFAIEKDAPKARDYGISMTPAAVLKKGADTGIRFFGTPSGHEFPVFIDTLSRLSSETPNVSPAGIQALAALKVPAVIKVFVTPS